MCVGSTEINALKHFAEDYVGSIQLGIIGTLLIEVCA